MYLYMAPPKSMLKIFQKLRNSNALGIYIDIKKETIVQKSLMLHFLKILEETIGHLSSKTEPAGESFGFPRS